jgi:hypothetical protein
LSLSKGRMVSGSIIFQPGRISISVAIPFL